MIKIAVVDNGNFCDYPTGGQLTSITNFLMYIAQQHHKSIEVVLIGITRNKHETGKLIDVEVNGSIFKFLPVACDTSSPNNPSRSVRKLFMEGIFLNRRAIKRLKAELFYIHAPEAYLPLKLYFSRSKFAVFSHGNFYSIYDSARFEKYKNLTLKLISKCLVGFILKTADIIFVLEEKTLNQYKKLCENVFKVYNSINNELLKRDFDHTDIGIIKVLYVGRLSANKNVDKIIQAFHKLEDYYVLNIIGDGEEYGKLDKIIKELGLGNRVRLSGKKSQQEVIKDYTSSDVLILNSGSEGLPMVILEAMAAGLCILTTPVGAIGDVVKDGINGYYLDGTSKSIVDKLHKAKRELYSFYINNTAESQKYNYMNVNMEIVEKLDRLLKA